ncbi:MAG: hypothetical protein ACXWQO_18380 [Bdellovibrionota bacterium]
MNKNKKHHRQSEPELSEIDEPDTEFEEAIESGYHAPTPEDIDDIKHDHNTASKGAVTADEAVRRDVA